MQHDSVPVRERAQGRWEGILSSLGVERRYLQNKHGPCPICRAGRDRYRFDDDGGKGTFICGQCGAGDGFDLLMRVNGWDFAETARQVETVVGAAPYRKPSPRKSDEEIREEKRALWRQTQQVQRGDLVDQYLRSRGCGLEAYPPSLRTGPDFMLAAVSGIDGTFETLHRTIIRDGKRDRRLFSAGPVPEGGAVRLYPPAQVMGIAEGIETAISAAKLFRLPVWAALNTAQLEKWQPPVIAQQVTIFADSDPKYGGHKAAYALAHRLACRADELPVLVEAPGPGQGDWNDIWMRKHEEIAA